MIKITITKAQVFYKMWGQNPFSFMTGRIGTEFKRYTIFGVVKGESPSGNKSAYDPDQVFRVCDAEEYMQRSEFKAASLRARNLVDGMLRQVLHADYESLNPLLAELEYVNDRMHQIAQGMVIEPHRR